MGSTLEEPKGQGLGLGGYKSMGGRGLGVGGGSLTWAWDGTGAWEWEGTARWGHGYGKLQGPGRVQDTAKYREGAGVWEGVSAWEWEGTSTGAWDGAGDKQSFGFIVSIPVLMFGHIQ